VTTIDSPTPPITPPTDHRSPRRRNQRRRGIVAVLIASLLASAGARYWVDTERSAAIPHRGEDSATSSLGGMNSFALGLLLGGLRGPLVMFLWVQSESQKSDKNLEGVDTQIEWIRLLQPEFDTVHIFQIWNKAYNISVQMASRANKYSVILGALDYAHSVDVEKPEDINILAAIGNLYFQKLGDSAEKYYYRKRVREETIPTEPARPRQASGQRTRLDPVCDDHFNILPALTAPRYDHGPRPANLPADTEFDTGAELQYLPQFQPFNDGVSTFALAYNYAKRAEVQQSVYKQVQLQMSDQVIDSRPALSLKFWTEEALDQGRRREFYAYGFNYPENVEDPRNLDDIAYKTARDSQTLVHDPFDFPWLSGKAEFAVPPGTNERAERTASYKLAIHDYDEAAKACALGEIEYHRHIRNFPMQAPLYESHLLQMGTQGAMAAGDRDYLKAMLATGPEREALKQSAGEHYDLAIDDAARSLLKYYLSGKVLQVVLPPGYTVRRTSTTKGVDEMTHQQLLGVLGRELGVRKANPNFPQNQDRYEYDRYIGRAFLRENSLGRVTDAPPAAATIPMLIPPRSAGSPAPGEKAAAPATAPSPPDKTSVQSAVSPSASPR
jgi:hypothetical protein